MSELVKVCDGYYSVYQKKDLYCFIRPKCEKESISLAESYDLNGQYVFCDTDGSISSQEQLMKDIEMWLRRQNRPVRFLWIENPGDSPGMWKLHFLVWANVDKAEHTESLVLERYRLTIESGTSLTCQGDAFYFEKKTETDDDTGAEPAAAYYLEGPDIRIAGKGMLCLKTEGDECGAFCGTLVCDDEMLMQKLEAGICFSSVREDDSFRGFLHSVMNPVLFPEESLTIEMRLAAHALLEGSRTCFHLRQGRFTSSFSSTLGDSVRLEAKEDAALVFMKRPVQAYRAKADGENGIETKKLLYLGLSGHFKLLSDIPDLLCGLTGTENVKMEKESLYFVPAMPGVSPYKEMALGTASWMGIDGSVSYFCQPESSVLFAKAAEDKERYLRVYEIPEAEFTDGMPPVPIMPYRQSRILAQDNAAAWEEEIYVRRREILTGRIENPMIASADEDIQTILSVSQQGIMAQTDMGRNFLWLGLANVSEKESLPNLRFNKVDDELKRRFMQKQFSYLINTKEDLEKLNPSPEFCFSVEGICFELLPEKWITGKDKKNTLLLLKYAEDKSIKELLSDNAVFEEALQNAYTKDDKVKEGYQEFLEIVEKPGFQGIFALNVSVSITQMPETVKILMKTVEPQNFYAAYLSIQSGRIKEDWNGSLYMERAEINAVIDYQTDTKLVYEKTPPDYDYLTREIKIEIAAGRIRSFTSSSEVLVNRLFGARADAKENPDGNCLVLLGKLVEEAGVSKYQYTLKQKTEYELYGSGIASAAVESMNLTVDESGNGIFTINGSMAGRELSGADLLGFDKLSFSSLLLSMPKSGKMAMDISRLALDAVKAKWREDSFPLLFAVTLQGFVSASDSPQSLGYQPITAPVTQSVPEKRWQGFRWKIALGNQGALSSQTVLSMELLTAFWETQDNNTGYYLGVRLPGALAGQETSLQGIMRMGFDNISLEKIEDKEKAADEKKTDASEVTNVSKTRYVIKLHNYHVSLLGLSFPQGSNDVFLFSDGKTVGWYGAYVEKGD